VPATSAVNRAFTDPRERQETPNSGDVRRLSCGEALELVDALLLVVTRMDAVVEERHGTPTDATGDRED